MLSQVAQVVLIALSLAVVLARTLVVLIVQIAVLIVVRTVLAATARSLIVARTQAVDQIVLSLTALTPARLMELIQQQLMAKQQLYQQSSMTYM